MAKYVQVAITGVAEVDRLLASIPPNFQRKAIRRAADESARMVAAEAKQRAPVDSGEGQIEASVKRRAIRRSRVRLGRSVIAGGPFEDRAEDVPFYAAFVELGTKERRHKSGKSIGRIDIKETDTPFLRPALYDNESTIKRLFFTQLKEAVRQLQTFGKLQRRSRAKVVI